LALSRFTEPNHEDTLTTQNGHKHKMSIYYKDLKQVEKWKNRIWSAFQKLFR